MSVGTRRHFRNTLSSTLGRRQHWKLPFADTTASAHHVLMEDDARTTRYTRSNVTPSDDGEKTRSRYCLYEIARQHEGPEDRGHENARAPPRGQPGADVPPDVVRPDETHREEHDRCREDVELQHQGL